MGTHDISRTLDDELAVVPPGPPPGDYVRSGRRALRRRRALTGAGAVGAAAVLLGTTAVAGGVLDDPASTTPAQFAAMDDADVVARCAEAENVADANVERLYGAGTPELMARDSSGVTVRAALRSADGRFWGSCFLRLDEGGEFGSGLELHRTEPDRDGGWSYGFGPGCRLSRDETTDGDCTKFAFHMVDRRPQAVARVKIVTADGQVTWAPTNEGYFAVDVVGDLPDGMTVGERGLPQRFEPLRVMALYDADGTLLAKQDFTKRVRYRDGEEVEPLDDYPSLAGEAIY
jgi:hypothetical protein